MHLQAVEVIRTQLRESIADFAAEWNSEPAESRGSEELINFLTALRLAGLVDVTVKNFEARPHPVCFNWEPSRVRAHRPSPPVPL